MICSVRRKVCFALRTYTRVVRNVLSLNGYFLSWNFFLNISMQYYLLVCTLCFTKLVKSYTVALKVISFPNNVSRGTLWVLCVFISNDPGDIHVKNQDFGREWRQMTILFYLMSVYDLLHVHVNFWHQRPINKIRIEKRKYNVVKV